MQRPPSLTLRLTTLFAVVAIIVFTGFGWLLERSMEQHFDMEDDAELNTILSNVSRLLNKHDNKQNAEPLGQHLSDILAGHQGALLYITDQNSHVIFASKSHTDLSQIHFPMGVNLLNGSTYQWNDGKQNFRVLSKQLVVNVAQRSTRYIVSIAVAVDHHLRFIVGFQRTLWFMIISGIVIMATMGWVAVRQGHGPLRAIVAQISHISAAKLDTRLDSKEIPLELADLSTAFNAMLQRMEESFQRLSNFSADLAHEFRTPIANLLTQSQVALSKTRSEAEYREILYSNIEEYERLAQMVNDMLFLAKADNAIDPLNKVNIALHEEIKALFEFYEAWAEERGVSLVLHGEANNKGDKLMLRRAVANLISNAIRHTRTNNTVIVNLSQTDRTTTISVENPGPTIDKAHLPYLFDRFYRVDNARHRGTEGAGLGLAIAKSIVEMHGGTIEVVSENERTRFWITLPTMENLSKA